MRLRTCCDERAECWETRPPQQELCVAALHLSVLCCRAAGKVRPYGGLGAGGTPRALPHHLPRPSKERRSFAPKRAHRPQTSGGQGHPLRGSLTARGLRPR